MENTSQIELVVSPNMDHIAISQGQSVLVKHLIKEGRTNLNAKIIEMEEKNLLVISDFDRAQYTFGWKRVKIVLTRHQVSPKIFEIVEKLQEIHQQDQLYEILLVEPMLCEARDYEEVNLVLVTLKYITKNEVELTLVKQAKTAVKYATG